VKKPHENFSYCRRGYAKLRNTWKRNEQYGRNLNVIIIGIENAGFVNISGLSGRLKMLSFLASFMSSIFS